MSTIYCDEAGNSGENLFDREQPFFVLCSNDYGKFEAEDLLGHVRSMQGGEPKFKTLKKTPDGVARLARFFSDPRLNDSRVVVDVYHKRFMVVTKMVDLIAETLMHEMNQDIYADGLHIALSNMLYHSMPVFCGEEISNKFLQSFVNLIRKRTDVEIEAYFEAGKAMLDASKYDGFKDMLAPFVDRKHFSEWFDCIGPLALNPAIPSLFYHIDAWGRKKTERFSVIHDRSKPVLMSKDDFEQMMALDEEFSVPIGYGHRKFHFPIRAKSLEEGDSTEYPQIQIADICAGAFFHFLKCQECGTWDDVGKMIRDIGCVRWISNGLTPDPQAIVKEHEESHEGTNPINPVVDYLRQRRGRN